MSVPDVLTENCRVADAISTIVKTLGYNNLITLLLTAPPYIWAAGWYMGLTWWSDVSMINFMSDPR